MLQIEHVDLDRIADLHYRNCRDWVLKAIQKSKQVKKRKRWRKYLELLNYLESNINIILPGKPSKLEKTIRELDKKALNIFSGSTSRCKQIRKTLKHIFNYKLFSEDGIPFARARKWDAYQLAEICNVIVCPYCNRHHIFTVKRKSNGKRLIRPEFDHVLTQNSYPIFSLSFYNLVPSCHDCNHVKSDNDFNSKIHLHPYVDGLEPSDIVFDFEFSGTSKAATTAKDVRVKLEPKAAKTCSRKFSRNVTILGLKEIYEKYNGYVANMIRQWDKYSPDYHKTLKKMNVAISKEDAYRVAFANEYWEEDFWKSPLSKLTKDIVSRLDKL